MKQPPFQGVSLVKMLNQPMKHEIYTFKNGKEHHPIIDGEQLDDPLTGASFYTMIIAQDKTSIMNQTNTEIMYRPFLLGKMILLTAILMIGTLGELLAQSSNGCLTGRFGIDAGLYSGVIEFGSVVEPATPPQSNDWFEGAEGLGVIDETDPTTLQTLLMAPGNPTYERRMAADLVSINEGQIWIDAVFTRDQFGGTGAIDPTSFLTASKNGEDPAIWDPGPSNVLGKNDIVDLGGMMFRDGETLEDGDLWFVGLFNMAEPGGASYMDFEFFVEDVQYEPATGFTSGGPQLGHTAYTFNPDGSIATIGDFIFSVALLGSGPEVEIRLWVSRDDFDNVDPDKFNWAGTFDGAFNNAPFGYAGIVPKNGSGFFCGYTNQGGETPQAPPWGTKNTKTNTFQTTYQENSVSEVAINITSFGMDHVSLEGLDPCEFPLNTFLVKTRASASFTAQLKDFAGPYEWGQPQFNSVLDITEISCENETATITSEPFRSDADYVWSTIDGNILSGQGTNEIVVDEVGTYGLEIVLPDGCPVPGESVTVGLDPNFPFFDGPPTYSYTVPCNDNDGTITVSASGATKPYTFSLYKDNVFQEDFTVGNTESSHTFTGLGPGDYRVDVKGVYPCIESTGPFTVPARIPVVITETITDVACFGAKTGAINLAVSGGNPPLMYLWSNGATSQNLLNIGAGSYTISITDSDNCVTEETFVVAEPTQITATFVKVDDPGNDGDGSAEVFPSGGTPPYTYQWEGPNMFTSTSKAITDLGYGLYTVTVTDALGCETVFSTFIFEKEICDDGIDNSGNGLTDCDDPDCEPDPTSAITVDPPPICVGEMITYSVVNDPVVDEYVWTVPSNATLFSGQGTNEIVVIWNTIAGGLICVQAKVFDCLSAPVCIDTDVEDVPLPANNIQID